MIRARGAGAARLAALASVGLVLLVGACSSAPDPQPPSAIASLQPIALPGGAVGVQRATLVVPLIPRLGPGPDGPEMRTEPDGLPFPLEVGRRVVILGEPQPRGDRSWVRVWVEPSTEVWPGDFYAWIAASTSGRDNLQPIDRITCPTEATIQTLAPLVQQDRLQCVGKLEVTIDARTGSPGAVPLYDVDPAWYGINNGPPLTSLFDPGPARFGPDATKRPEEAGTWIETHVPPGVTPLPLGMYLRVTGHFDDPTAAGCRRVLANAGLGLGPPAEAAADSTQWCREQFVVGAWQALLGPEGRPIDLAAPQLHRREFRPEPGIVLACGGVGMPPLTIRIDPSQIDPVWVESGPNRRRSMAVFGPEFQLRLDPPRVVATTGLTLTNGEVIDPDRGKPGLAVCPGGDTISFDVLP